MTPLSENQFQKMLDRFLAGQCSPEEEQLVQDWYASLWKEDEPDIRPDLKAQLENRLWNTLSDRMTLAHPSGKQRNLWPFVRIAAAILLVAVAIGAFFLPSQPEVSPEVIAFSESKEPVQVIENSEASPQPFVLADGSRITLEPGSRLKFQQLTESPLRTVYLEGDGFFEIAHDKTRPFLVYTGAVVTKVLGTSFSIKNTGDGETIDIIVKTGKVAVSKVSRSGKKNTEESPVIVTPNQKATYQKSHDHIIAGIIDNPKPLPAQEDRLQMKFDAVSVTDILLTIESAYGITLRYDPDKLKACLLTTELTEEGLYERLNIICQAIGGDYTVNQNEIVITTNGCN